MMGFLGRLRRIMGGLLGGEDDELERTADVAAGELRAAKAVAALAIAQARRTELALRDALTQTAADERGLAGLVAQLEEERAHAEHQVSRYHDLQRRAEDCLARLGEAHRLAALNAERDSLRTFIAGTESALDAEAASRLEDQARAEAAALDVLEALDGGLPPPLPRETAAPAHGVRAHAEELLGLQPFSESFPGSRSQ